MIESDVQKLAVGDIIDLFELDSTDLGGEVFRWSNDVNEKGNDIVWQGNTYSRFPVQAEGFQKSGTGKSPRPTITVANVTGLIGALTKQLNDLVGATVTRRRTLVKYLDAVNFEGDVNPQADPNVGFSDEIWTIDRKSAENGIFITFELAAAFDLAGVMLPGRQVTRICTSKYRSAECGYAGGPVADVNDDPTSDLSKDVCGKRIGSCVLRFGENKALPYGGFPGVGRI
jgi:lambda family phage minor tail protein L